MVPFQSQMLLSKFWALKGLEVAGSSTDCLGLEAPRDLKGI